jgi:integrase
MHSVPLLDYAGRRRSRATVSGFHQGGPPRNQGLRYPPDPPTVEEIIAVVRAVGDRPDGPRLRGVVVVLWRAGLRISEALALKESDLDRTRGAVLIRRGRGGKRREVGQIESGGHGGTRHRVALGHEPPGDPEAVCAPSAAWPCPPRRTRSARRSDWQRDVFRGRRRLAQRTSRRCSRVKVIAI